MTLIEEIQHKAATLPESLAREVLDFMDHVRSKYPDHPTDRQHTVKTCRGAFLGKLSSSEDFAAAKVREKRLER